MSVWTFNVTSKGFSAKKMVKSRLLNVFIIVSELEYIMLFRNDIEADESC